MCALLHWITGLNILIYKHWDKHITEICYEFGLNLFSVLFSVVSQKDVLNTPPILVLDIIFYWFSVPVTENYGLIAAPIESKDDKYTS